MLLLLGEARFGPPDEKIRSDVDAIRAVERLERMTKQVLDRNLLDWN